MTLSSTTRKLRWAIVGSGAVGGLYGGMLAHHGEDVHFLLRSDYEHVQQHGLRIDSKLGDIYLVSPQVYASIEAMPRCDVVLIALKSVHNHLLADWLPRLVTDHGVVLNLQNGLGVEQACFDALASHPDRLVNVLGGCCFLCSNKVGPGHIHHLDYGRIVFGQSFSRFDETAPAGVREFPIERSHLAADILAAMTRAGIDAHWTDHLLSARWRKLMWNIPFNGLSVALDASTDEIVRCPESRRLADAIIREVYQGAADCGVPIDPDAIEKTMTHTETMVPYDSSMRLDYRHGRPMEIEAILGVPLRTVAEATGGVGMPRVEMLYQQLCFLQARRGHTVES